MTFMRGKHDTHPHHDHHDDHVRDRLDAILAALTATNTRLQVIETHSIQLGAALLALAHNGGTLMALLDGLVAKVAALTTVTEGTHAIVQATLDNELALRAQVTALQDQLAAAGTTDPAVQATVDALSASVDANIASLAADKDALAAANVAGTAAAGEVTP